jgi:hypothetical protein
MKAWSRAASGCLCGLCGKEIPTGQRYLGFSRPEGKRALIRCEGCAGERPPAVVEQAVSPFPVPRMTPQAVPRMTKLSLVKMPVDFKLAQAGEREPGSDDE